MKFKPLSDRVVIKPDLQESKTPGGIIIPDTSREKPLRGEVLAVGSGARDQASKLIPFEVQVGDTVLYGKWGGTDIKIDGEDLVVVKESDIIGIFR